MQLAACVEFIHTATLLHDDVVDESRLRRGLASANAVFGNKASVLVGDFLFARAFQLMVADGALQVLRILSNAAATIAEGEVLQLSRRTTCRPRSERYLEVIQGKTAALFAAACQVGARGRRPRRGGGAGAVRFGLDLGMAFQLVDDALDYAADQAEAGQDDRRRLPRGQADLPGAGSPSPAADADERRFWNRTIGDGAQTETDLAAALHMIGGCNAIERTLARAEAFVETACAALQAFAPSPMRAALIDVARYTTARRF